MSNREPAYLLLACAGLCVVAFAVGSVAIPPGTPRASHSPLRPPPHGVSQLDPEFSSTRPTTLPANGSTRPSAVAASWKKVTPLPDDYSGLLRRSLFGRRASGPVGPDGKPIVAGPMPPGLEATLAFRGAGLLDGRYTAFIEDAQSKQIKRVGVGEAIASGRVVGITLDRLDYEMGGRVVAIALGHSLAGTPMPAPPPQPPQQQQPPNGQPAGPPNGRPPRGPKQMPPGAMPPGVVMEGVAAAPDGSAPAQAPQQGQPGQP